MIERFVGRLNLLTPVVVVVIVVVVVVVVVVVFSKNGTRWFLHKNCSIFPLRI